MVVILKNVLSTRAIYCGATVGGVSLHHIGMRTVGRARAPARERKVGIVSADAPILPRDASDDDDEPTPAAAAAPALLADDGSRARGCTRRPWPR